MNSIIKATSTAALAALLILGASGCAGETKPEPKQATESRTAVEEPVKERTGTAKEAVETIEGFFAAATSDRVAKDLKGKASGETFAEAVSFVESSSDSDRLKDAVADLAVLKLSAPKKDLKVSVDASDVVIEGDTATVPAKKLSVISGGKEVKNSNAIASQINDLVFVDGSWALTFPPAGK